jgi:selenocysteine-specific elongation factor
MDVICTAGHVDHGKSTLVKALTGMEPDRFAEERERGLTIDLGFAWTRLPAGRTVAFVDLPGHERFIANMLAGAGSLHRALFVVAADEGWMPQSREHLDILSLLEIRDGVVALTKTDLVDGDTAELAAELVREQLQGSALATAPIVAVSAATGAGLDDLRAALEAALDAAAPEADAGRPRLWIDRAFTVKGAGTVVTGTLAGGTLRTGDEVTVLPGGPTSRIRGLHALGEPITAAPPGGRVAVNLTGVPREAVRRGDVVGLPGQWLRVDSFDAWVEPLPGVSLGRTGAWHLHAGAAEVTARLHPVDGGRTVAGPAGVRIQLDAPLPLAAGDRFVLRESGRRATLGGGRVLDPAPPPRPRGAAARAARSAELRARLELVEAGDRPGLLIQHVAERDTAARDEALAAVGLPPAAAGEAVRAQRLLPLGDALVHPSAATRWAAAVTGALARHHAAHPVDRAAPKDVARTAAVTAGCPRVLAPAFVDLLVHLRRLAAEGPGVRLPDHRVELDPAQARARQALLRLLGRDPFAPPALSAAARESGASAALVRELESAGDVVRLGPDLAVAGDALDAAAERLRAAFDAEGPLTAARAKEVLGTSRKFALPLLEELDRRGRTRRRGDVRDVVG